MSFFFKRYFEKNKKSLASQGQMNRNIRNIVWPNGCFTSIPGSYIPGTYLSRTHLELVFLVVCFLEGDTDFNLPSLIDIWLSVAISSHPIMLAFHRTSEMGKDPRDHAIPTHKHSTLLPPSLNSRQSR